MYVPMCVFMCVHEFMCMCGTCVCVLVCVWCVYLVHVCMVYVFMCVLLHVCSVCMCLCVYVYILYLCVVCVYGI